MMFQVFDCLKVTIKKSTIQSQKKNVDKFAKDIKSKFSCIDLAMTSDSIEIQSILYLLFIYVLQFKISYMYFQLNNIVTLYCFNIWFKKN